MSRPVLLDLFCGAGGAARGYYESGFDVVGVDINPQPNYPYMFIQEDAVEFAWTHAHTYDAIHASPPCQVHTPLARFHKGTDYMERHVDLIPQTRAALVASGRPYVIENVPGAVKHLINPIMLCGASFGLKVYRHRFFELSHWMLVPPHCDHIEKVPAPGNGAASNGFINVAGHGGAGFDGMPYLDYARFAMGIDWMTRDEIAQSIPPAYTRYIGAHLFNSAMEATR